ncbi:MAG: hypothetical protein MZW92_40275 [Comamonadaceae bacterium]|nr:hypothetical protein [Comamonadaceae bacterium]
MRHQGQIVTREMLASRRLEGADARHAARQRHRRAHRAAPARRSTTAVARKLIHTVRGVGFVVGEQPAVSAPACAPSWRCGSPPRSS